MQPRNPLLQSFDPRRLIQSEGEVALRSLLQSNGYVPQESALNDLSESLGSGMPLLVEGPRGSGKTALAEALAAACNLNLYYLQCMEGLALGDLLFQWDTAAQNQYIEQALKSGESTGFAEARGAAWTREFLKLGEVLAAYAETTAEGLPNVLIVDEIDKLPERNEDMLLQLFARGFAAVPRLKPNSQVGLPEGGVPPIVILTSNDLRSGVSGPLRSRCIYTFINPPTPIEEVMILKAQVPEASHALLSQLVKAVAYIRQMPSLSKNKPGLRETISLLKALVRKAAHHSLFSREIIAEHACYLAKQPKDRASLIEAAAAIAHHARLPHPVYDAAIREGLKSFEPETGKRRAAENSLPALIFELI